MLRTENVDRMTSDIASEFSKQFRYLLKAPVEKQADYEAAIKDSVIGVATALHRHISAFNVDSFYAQCGYPGTHPVHK